MAPFRRWGHGSHAAPRLPVSALFAHISRTPLLPLSNLDNCRPPLALLGDQERASSTPSQNSFWELWRLGFQVG